MRRSYAKKPPAVCVPGLEGRATMLVGRLLRRIERSGKTVVRQVNVPTGCRFRLRSSRLLAVDPARPGRRQINRKAICANKKALRKPTNSR